MKSRTLLSLGLIALVSVVPSAAAYNGALADSYAKLFAPVAGAQAGKALHLIKPSMLLQAMQTGKPISVIDIRTPKESAVIGISLPGTLRIPLNMLFTRDNLVRIPRDRRVILVCKAGVRAAAAGTALRHLGFDNVFILKGGIDGLAKHLSPVTDNTAPPAGK